MKWAEEKPVLSSQEHKQPPTWADWRAGVGGRSRQGTAAMMVSRNFAPRRHWPGFLNHCSKLSRSATGFTGLPSAAVPHRTHSKNIKSSMAHCHVYWAAVPAFKEKEHVSSPVTLWRAYATTENIWSKGHFQRGGINSSYLNHFVFLSPVGKRDIPSFISQMDSCLLQGFTMGKKINVNFYRKVLFVQLTYQKKTLSSISLPCFYRR